VDVAAWHWIAAVGLVTAMLTVDLVGAVRNPHAPSLKESAIGYGIYVSIALAFGLFVLWEWGGTFASEFYAGYITELSLSADNLFVFVLIIAAFRVPPQYQQKVILVGIIIAIVLRTVFIFLGAAAINAFAWVFYIFGAFLIYTAWTQVRKGPEDDDGAPKENGMLRVARRILPTTEEYHEDKLTTRIQGKRYVTPMLLVMIAIGSADVLFAVDSIPAIFGLTQEVFLVFTANAFSLLGLRRLYFLIDGLLDRLVYLSYGLAAILGFIGAKLVIHALHENDLPFINGGDPVHIIPEVSTVVSLTVIIGVLVITTVTSLWKDRKDRQQAMMANAED